MRSHLRRTRRGCGLGVFAREEEDSPLLPAAQTRPVAPLLFRARRNGFDVDVICRLAKTPQGLATLAGNLGLAAELPELSLGAVRSTRAMLCERRRDRQVGGHGEPKPAARIGSTPPTRPAGVTTSPWWLSTSKGWAKRNPEA